MNTRDLGSSLPTVFSELVNGAPESGAFVLNRGDAGLLRSLDKLSAAAASVIHHGGSSIAAHAEHLRYGLSLLNEWAAGGNPWDDADWAASWKRTKVTEEGWQALRSQLADEAHQWLEAMRKAREVDDAEMSGLIGSVAHLAYHVGAIRQIDRSARGPSAND